MRNPNTSNTAHNDTHLSHSNERAPNPTNNLNNPNERTHHVMETNKPDAMETNKPNVTNTKNSDIDIPCHIKTLL